MFDIYFQRNIYSILYFTKAQKQIRAVERTEDKEMKDGKSASQLPTSRPEVLYTKPVVTRAATHSQYISLYEHLAAKRKLKTHLPIDKTRNLNVNHSHKKYDNI